MTDFEALLGKARQCTLCETQLPLGPRPVLQLHPQARILIAGQAPGLKVHQTGIPFDDASGERLRRWLGVSVSEFYDAKKIAIMPMGFCYPGKGKSGDLPPRPECAPKWRAPLLQGLKNIQLTLVIGQYALAYHLPNENQKVTDAVANWRAHWPAVVPLPHPSPRNNIWLKRNPWFTEQVIPALQQRVRQALTEKS
ncbi:IclR family transcriptional regulator [Aliidiomarina taiwanensis]|uniref:IclR family transcriptional regulator n=1 Tax=Aliidiomarina taiwanensis TaxID=946228 RepID=A0A432X013_9GAMM|nr:uracil-DNA glycosylase family protein [Aliidiomarina taiwanensis]RUO39353.1 IclR family transcriptional regulator [Aliidiomarina taiwanensis]